MSDIEVPPPQPKPAVQFSRGVTTGDTVTVGCKLPSGIILRIFTWQNYSEPLRDGTIREGKRAIPIPGQQFVVRGPWIATGGQAFNPTSAVADLLPGNYALTDGCPKDLWDTWHEQNKDSDLVKNFIVFACPDHQSAFDEARKHAAVLSGLEPLDRGNPGARMGGIDRRVRLDILDRTENR